MGTQSYAATIPPGSDPFTVQSSESYGVPDDVQLVRVNFLLKEGQTVSTTQRVMGWYAGDPETNTDFADLPKGTVIFDDANGKMYLKTAVAGTNTWVAFTGS